MKILKVQDYGGQGELAFVADNITCILADAADKEQTHIYVVGSDQEYVCNESYASVLKKLEQS